MFAVFARARKVAARFFALVSLMVLAACQTGGLTTALPGAGGPRINPDAPVPVALLLPKSDPSAGGVARSLENAVRLAISDLGARARIDLRVYDTAGNAATAASQAQAAVDSGAKIILGPLFAEAANAAGLAVADEGINVLSFSNNTSIAGGNVFVLGPTFLNTANRLMSFAARNGKRRVMVVHPNNVEGAFGRSAIETAAARNGLSVVGVESFEFSQQGVVSAVPRIVSGTRNSGADTLFLTSTSAGALPLLAQLLPESGLSGADVQWVGLARWDIPPQTLELPGLQGGWFTLPNQASINAFNDRYAATYGSGPHPLAGLGFDAIAAIGALVQEGKGNALTARALTQPAGFQGVGGAFRLLPDGTNERALAVARVDNGTAVVIDPAPRSFAGF